MFKKVKFAKSCDIIWSCWENDKNILNINKKVL